MIFKFGDISVDGIPIFSDGTLNVITATRQAKFKATWLDNNKPIDMYLIVTHISDIKVSFRNTSASCTLSGVNVTTGRQFKVDCGLTLSKQLSYANVYVCGKLKQIHSDTITVGDILDVLRMLSI